MKIAFILSRGTTTPTPTSGSGSFTSVSGSVRFVKICNLVWFKAAVVITTNGTAAGDVRLTMPFTAASTTPICGADNALAFGLMGHVTGSTLIVMKYDGTYPGADATTLNVSGVYAI